jgi:flotillin
MIYIIVAAALFALLLVPIMYRTIVETNMVHIVQRNRKTVSYGTGLETANVYYKFPAWIPQIGVTVIELPVSNFNVSLDSYEAYDKDRVPFTVDVAAFFRVKDTSKAAQRIYSTEQLVKQLTLIVQGAVRKTLAGSDIDSIMVGRAAFGAAFTTEVESSLEEWGVESVKSMELMDIRDSHGSGVIANIMLKQTSTIEMESRKKVAENTQLAQSAEIESQRTVAVNKTAAQQVISEREAQKNSVVGVANEKSQQDILDTAKVTAEKTVLVKRTQELGLAETEKQKAIIASELTAETVKIEALGALEAKKNESAGITIEGTARADAEKAMLLAPVEAQVTLAKEIGTNPEYQKYLVSVKNVDAVQAVGIANAEALVKADVKIIANTGSTASDGVSGIMDLFSAKGGTGLGAALEALVNTPTGEKVIAKVTGKSS